MRYLLPLLLLSCSAQAGGDAEVVDEVEVTPNLIVYVVALPDDGLLCTVTNAGGIWCDPRNNP